MMNLAEIAFRARPDCAAMMADYPEVTFLGVTSSGRWRGYCPFHLDARGHPDLAFSVSPALGIFHCFGCHAGGDNLEFRKRYDGVTLKVAAEWLARRDRLRPECWPILIQPDGG